MKKFELFLILFILSLSFQGHSQGLTVRGVIENGSTSSPLPYAHILFENYGLGTTSNINGQFGFSIPDSLRNENIIISHVGFETRNVSIQSVIQEKVISLKPKKESLDEVSITQILEENHYIFRPESRNQSVGIGNMNGGMYPSTIARFYPKPDKFTEECFIEYIQVYFYPVEEQKRLSPKFRLHIYEVNENGEPGKDLSDNMIIEKVPGKSNIEVGLLDQKIQVPENGFFVGLEHLFIEENKYTEVKDYYINDSLVAKDFEYQRYAPVYKGIFADRDSDLKVYYYQPQGWVNVSSWDITREESNENYVAPIFKIRITD